LIVLEIGRSLAIGKMQQALNEAGIVGVHSNQVFLARMLESEVFQKNQVYTRFVDENQDFINQQIQDKKNTVNRKKIATAALGFQFTKQAKVEKSVWNQIGFWRIAPCSEVMVDEEKLDCTFTLSSNGQVYDFGDEAFSVTNIGVEGNKLEISIDGQLEIYYCLNESDATTVVHEGISYTTKSNLVPTQVVLNRKNKASHKIFQNLICADLFGKVLKLNISEGELVQAGQVLLTLESMKTEIHILSPVDAQIKKILVAEGVAVEEKQLLLELEKQ